MRNFDIKLAKKGWPVITRDGHKARIICFDAMINGFPLVVLQESLDGKSECCITIKKDGHYCTGGADMRDLFLTDTWEGHDENGNPLNEPELPWNGKEQRPDNLVRFGNILDSMFRIYEAKNHDYGDSFSQSIQSYGPIAGLTRISDKFHRLESLIIKGDRMVKDERIGDTLLDMANYCVMLKMEIEK